jgi:hypothetical protein
MLRRLSVLVVLVLLPAVLVGLPQQAAQADVVPPLSSAWPRCLSYATAHGVSTTDLDNRYCVVSYEKRASVLDPWTDVPDPNWDANGVYDEPYVDLLDAGTVRFGLYETTVGPGGSTSDGDVDPGYHWRYRVNIGSITARELYGQTRNTDYSVSGGGASGSVLQLTFQPSPIAWRWPPGDPTQVCEPGDCGDSTTVAGLVYDGFVTGYVTDLATSGLGDAEIGWRTGMVRAWNANYAGDPVYRPDLNALDIQLANPHLVSSSPDVVATGYYEVFLPGPYLTNVMQVPDPSTLSGGTFTVSRVGSTSTVPFSLAHEGGGIRIVIHSITFSSPKFRLKPRPTAPGRPRWGSVTRATATKVKLSFRRPLADGGPSISAYQGRCRRGTGTWHYNRAGASPIYIGSLSRLPVDCQVRAQNRIGYGRWNVLKRG